MMGGMSDQNPPPHASESTGSKITMRVRIAYGIGGGGLSFLFLFVVVPWIGNLLDVSKLMAIVLSFGILFMLLVVYVWGWNVGARTNHNQ